MMLVDYFKFTNEDDDKIREDMRMDIIRNYIISDSFLISDERNTDLDTIEDKVMDVLRPVNPLKVMVFQMYYNIGDYKYVGKTNFRELGKRLNVDKGVLHKWVRQTLVFVITEIKKDKDYDEYFDK